MSDYMGDLSGYYPLAGVGGQNALEVKKNNEKFDLNMEDFLMLMVTELKSQSIDHLHHDHLIEHLRGIRSVVNALAFQFRDHQHEEILHVQVELLVVLLDLQCVLSADAGQGIVTGKVAHITAHCAHILSQETASSPGTRPRRS